MENSFNDSQLISPEAKRNEEKFSNPNWLLKKIILLLSVKPFGLGGLVLKARHSPTRDKVIKIIEGNISEYDLKRIHPNVSELHLDGGLDFASSLEKGKAVYSKGIFDGAAKFIKLVMGERIEPKIAAKFSQRMDSEEKLSLIILDEGIGEEEQLPSCLSDRTAFCLNLDGIPHSIVKNIQIDKNKVEKARQRLAKIIVPEQFLVDVTSLAMSLGIQSLRTPIFTVKIAGILAALRGASQINQEDILESISLTISHKARFFPDFQENEPVPEKNQSEDMEAEQKKNGKTEDIPLELLIEAAKAQLPISLLTNMEKGNETREKGLVNNSGSGQKKISYLRGRPLPSHQGTPNGRNRIDVIATLRVAAPWQKLRNPSKNIKNEIYTKNKKIEFRKTDIRIKRYQDLKYRLIIFSVDASGSLAVGRLAEAKGAVELLLAKAYSSRDQVALVAFRGEAAETLLTPSKSLTKTKRALSSLPGGGGTPLAAGLKATLKMALDYRHKGFSPVAVILTDGKANIDLEGGKGREKATEDSTQMAKLFSANEVKSILIDTSNRMQESAEQLANHLGGQYLALPRANAKQLSNAVMSKLN